MLSFPEILAALPAHPLMTVTGLPFPKVASGKVREVFDVGDAYLMVATDRLSAFDVILPDGIAGKGVLLTQLSLHWFSQAEGLIPTHLLPDHDRRLAVLLRDRPQLIPYSMLVRKLRPLPVEAVVRGYLAGSGWKDYQKTGTLFGQAVPPGLVESEALPEPFFTPSSKAVSGHDEPLSLDRCREVLGERVFRTVREVSFSLYKLGSMRAAQVGILLADTKFEFGTDETGRVHLIDEVLTPDSSRFWPADAYRKGVTQPSYDKQFVRDYLESLGWNKTPPGPSLPVEVIEGTRDRYLEAVRKLVG